MSLFTLQCCFAALEGCFGVLLGNRLCGKAKRSTDLTNFQKAMFSVGAAFSLMLATELFRFFSDYLIPGSALQHYDLTPPPELLFFRVFGRGVAEEGQTALLATDLRCFYCLIGTFLSGALLLMYYERKSKISGDGNGLLDGCSAEPFRLKTHLQDLIKAFKNELHPWEYGLWWLLRIAMLVVMQRKYLRDPADFCVILLGINCAITFLIPLMRLISVRKLFFGKLPLRLQSYVNVIIFGGSFLCHGCDLNGKIDNIDKYLHMLTGGLCVLIGYLIIRSTRRGDLLSPGVCVAGAGGFSCFVGIAWEIFEFFADYYRKGSMNQNWEYRLNKNQLFAVLMGCGAGNTGQQALLDTDLDLLSHLFFCILISLLLYASVKARISPKNERQVLCT